MINIPKNDYVEDTSINEEVVQGICNAFLKGRVWHPDGDGWYRKSKNYVAKLRNDSRFHFFGNYRDAESSDYVTKHFNESEMRMAWKELIAAGYHMFEIREYGSWYGYKCDKRPYYNGGREVTDFDERWT
jgi:hypothetical protein